MIDIMELHKEQEDIANMIINRLYGIETNNIPYFTYHGCSTEREWAMRGQKGIYIFTVTDEIELSNEMISNYNGALNWNGTLVGAGFNYPFPSKLEVGDVFYLGKVSGKKDSLYRRLQIHYGERTNSATNGIKMKMSERSFIDGKLSVHTFFFNRNYLEVMQIIIDPVEKMLHEKLRPITGGKQ